MNNDANCRRVIAIGLDAAELGLIEKWIAARRLPHIEGLFGRGLVASARTDETGYVAETTWTVFLTGCRPTKTGYWSTVSYSPDYSVRETGAYDYSKFQPFYAYCHGLKVIALDVPHARASASVDGIQVLAWGAHSPLGPSVSVPPGVFDMIVKRHGKHPTLNDDWMSIPETESRTISLEQALVTGIRRRTDICVDFMRNEPWDLLLVVYGESHSAGHAIWHLSQPDHPLYSHYADPDHDPLLNVFQAIDTAVGRILAHAPRDAYVVLFATEGMKANSSDLPSWVFIPELMFRHSFGGRAGLAKGKAGGQLEPLGRYAEDNWLRSVWSLREDKNPLRRAIRRHAKLCVSWAAEKVLGSGFGPAHPLSCRPFNYMPPMWYRPFWPEMTAFALPSFSDGYVRINLRGRETHGKVDSADYDRMCTDISTLLHDLRDGRTGAPVVRSVIRVRDGAETEGRYLPDADLVVLWADRPSDVVDSPACGRIGPAPLRRSGDHTPRGFFVVAGPGIAGGRLPDCELVDVAPTILALLGSDIPGHFDGRPQIDSDASIDLAY